MPITLKTPKSEIEAHIDLSLEKVRNRIIDTFMYVGEQCVTEARDHPGYTDQTANLRSSIGYAVVEDGRVVTRKGFEVISGVRTDKNGKQHSYEGSHGSKEGEDFLERLIAKHPTGIALIVVAGMNYAEYVESKGRNVLTSAELLAERMVPQLLTQLGFTIK